jgi:hypothetical protein
LHVTGRTLTILPILLLTLALSLAAQPSQSAPAAFDERSAAEVLGTIRDGLEAHSQRLFLSAFDADKMDGFLTFQDQIEAYFTRYEGFRVSLHILQTSEENNRGVILADFQLESEPRGGGRISRRQGQLRFEVERNAKGWKIVDFNPRGFFS